MTYTQGKKQLIEIVFEYPHMLDLEGKILKQLLQKSSKN